MESINRTLAKIVTVAGLVFMAGSITLLVMTGSLPLILWAAFGATTSAFAANRLSQSDENTGEIMMSPELVQAA